MVKPSGEVKVMDFGIANLRKPGETPRYGKQSTDVRAVRSAMNYAAPEQALGEPLDSRVDVFSTGVLLYEMLTGRLPFRNALLNEEPPRLTEVSSGPTPEGLQQVLNRALAKDRGARYHDIMEFKDDLNSVMRQLERSYASKAETSDENILHANLWIEDDYREPVSQPLIISTSDAYFLLFAIENKVRERISSTQLFVEPESLQEKPISVVEIVVSTDLLKEATGQETRQVEYYAGTGTLPEAFALYPRVEGRHPVTIRLFYRQTILYRERFCVDVIARLNQAHTETLIMPRTQEVAYMANFDEFIQPNLTLTLDLDGNSLYLSYRTPGNERKDRIRLPVPPDQITDPVILMREELSNWAKKYEEVLDKDKKDRLSCDPVKIKDMWTYLAQEGQRLYRLIFDLDDQTDLNLVKLAENIKERLEPESTIEIDASQVPIPWSMLFDDEIPSVDDPLYLEKLLPHFWGIRHQLTVHPPLGTNTFNNKPYLANTDGTRLTIGVNKQTDLEYQTGQMTFFQGMEEKFKQLTDPEKRYLLMLGTSKEQVISSLTKREEPQHLYYLFCHHEKGEGEITIYGISDKLKKTQIIMEGQQQGVITLQELSDNRAIRPFRSPPVIFLNACQSSKLKMGDPTSFMTYFIRRLGSWNFVGTEADIPAPFADAFGQRFVKEFLKGKRVGEILFDFRKDYARRYFNPFGLYYTLFGRGEIHLQNPVAGVTP
ncbi:MAG TPA: protein kinase [Pyrinomonadaceae bacterium]|nr:protein kinase [Pyrinomonadaceae bacterium]